MRSLDFYAFALVAALVGQRGVSAAGVVAAVFFVVVGARASFVEFRRDSLARG